jgi:amino acid transporter
MELEDRTPEKKRVDRELIELLNELRVALPGVQVMFAFLLTVPFTQRFTDLTDSQRNTFFAAFISAALSTAFLIAPSAYHRVRFRAGDKERLLITSNVFAIVGMFFLAVATTLVVFLITDLLFSGGLPAIFTGLFAGLFAFLWYGLPLFRHFKDGAQKEKYVK